MAHPLQHEPLSTVHVKDGDILTVGRWQSFKANPQGPGDWQFQQFDIVFTTGDVTEKTVDRHGLDVMAESGDWGVFAIKRPQTAPPVIEAADVPEEAPTDS